MDQQVIRDILSGRRRGIGPGALRAALWAVSKPYCAAMRLRRWAYGAGLLASQAANVSPAGRRAPVICVGNITTGGTGKTPMVAWLVNHLRRLGRKPAVLMRGYKAVGGRSDEAELLRQLCNAPLGNADPPDVPIVINPDRVAGAAAAIEAGADVLVMDDGFQHRRLRRDLDIVLIDATNPFGYGHCLPRGLLREGLWALRAAHILVVTHAEAVGQTELEALRSRLTALAPGALLCVAQHVPTEAIDERLAPHPFASLAGRKVMAFCGLGNPDAFFGMARRSGATLAAALPLEDHVAYAPAVVEMIRRRGQDSGAELCLTTQKDAVKLVAADLGLPLWQLAVRMEVTEGQPALVARIGAAVSDASGPAN